MTINKQTDYHSHQQSSRISVFNKANEITSTIQALDPKYIIKNMKKGFGMLLSTQRAGGKTYTLRDVLFNMKYKFDEVFLISNTHEFNTDYDYIDKDNKFSTTDMNELIQRKTKEQGEKLKNGEKMKQILFIFDDVLDDKNITGKNSENPLIPLSTLGRHRHMSFILLTQYFKSIPPVIRRNVDYAMISKMRSISDIEAFCESFMTGINEGKELNKKQLALQVYYNLMDEPFTWLFAHNTNQTAVNYEDFIFKYQASPKPPPKGFRLQKATKTSRKSGKDKTIIEELNSFMNDKPREEIEIADILNTEQKLTRKMFNTMLDIPVKNKKKYGPKK